MTKKETHPLSHDILMVDLYSKEAAEALEYSWNYVTLLDKYQSVAQNEVTSRVPTFAALITVPVPELTPNGIYRTGTFERSRICARDYRTQYAFIEAIAKERQRLISQFTGFKNVRELRHSVRPGEKWLTHNWVELPFSDIRVQGSHRYFRISNSTSGIPTITQFNYKEVIEAVWLLKAWKMGLLDTISFVAEEVDPLIKQFEIAVDEALGWDVFCYRRRNRGYGRNNLRYAPMRLRAMEISFDAWNMLRPEHAEAIGKALNAIDKERTKKLVMSRRPDVQRAPVREAINGKLHLQLVSRQTRTVKK